MLTIALFSSLLFSQQIKILDAENQKPIPYAKLILKDKDYYKNTEENGQAQLENTEEISEIQSFGYENLKVEKYQTVYLLKPKFTEIEEVEISKPKFKKSFTLGSIKKSKFGFFASKKTWNLVDLFKGYFFNEKLYIKKIRIPTEVPKQIKEATFNLIFYENENGEPGTERIKNIVVTCKSGKNITEIDFSKNPIAFPKEGFFIGFEWIVNEQNSYTYKTNFIHSDGKKEKNVTQHATAPKFKGVESDSENIKSFINNKWADMFNKKVINNSNYSLSIELELTN